MNPLKLPFIFLTSLLLGLSAHAEEYPEVKPTQVGEGLYMLSAKGGNLGLFISKDTTFLIDDQFAAGTEAILGKIKELGGTHPNFLINTHFHGDHTGGNEAMGADGTLIYSHHNVRKRLTVENLIEAFNFRMPPMGKLGLPTITFADNMTFYIDDEVVDVFHPASAHTDGDAVIHFKKANAIHAGDIFFNGFYPFIDPRHGGSLKGLIDAVDTILDRANADTKIIPGHGPLANRNDLQEYRNMLATAYERLMTLKQEGKTLKQIQAANPLDDLSARWGNAMFTSERWISIIFSTL